MRSRDDVLASDADIPIEKGAWKLLYVRVHTSMYIYHTLANSLSVEYLGPARSHSGNSPRPLPRTVEDLGGRLETVSKKPLAQGCLRRLVNVSSLMWRACNVTAFTHSSTGPVVHPFASHHERPGFNPQGGSDVKLGFSS